MLAIRGSAELTGTRGEAEGGGEGREETGAKAREIPPWWDKVRDPGPPGLAHLLR